MNNSRMANSARNSFWGIVNRFVMMLGPFIFRAIIIRHIGAEYVGLNGLFKSILNVLNMTELGFGTSIVFMMYKPIAEKNVAEVRQLLNLMRRIYKYIGLIILVLGCCIYPFLDQLVKNDTGADVNLYILYSMYLANTVLSYLMFAYRSSLFTAYQRNDVVMKISIACEIIMYLIQGVVLAITRNYYLYLLVFTLMIIPQNLMYYLVSKKMFPEIYCEGEPTKEQKDTLKGKIVPLMGHRIGGKLIVSIDGIIISSMLGITALTKYDNYYYVVSALVGIFTIIRNGMMASIGNKIYTDSAENTYIMYRRIVFIWIGLVGWCSACMAGVFQPFISLWVGQEYLYDTLTMMSLVAYFFLWQFRYIGVTMKDSAGLWEPDMYKPYIGSVFNLIFSIAFVKITGSVLGVLYPTMFVMVFIFFPWETWALFSKLFKRSCKDYLVLVARCVLSSVISIIVTYYVGTLIGGVGVSALFLRAFCCAVIAALIYLIVNFNSSEMKYALSIAKRLVHRKIAS